MFGSKLLFFFISLTIIGCSENKSLEVQNDKSSDANNKQVHVIDGDPSYNIEFIKDLSIGDTEEVFFRSIGEFAIDEKDRIYIADTNHIKVFDQNGNYITSLGRRGRGPGEFMNFGSLSPKVSYNKLFAYDEIEQRINVYNLELLEPEYSIPINPGNWNTKENLARTKFERYFIVGDSLIIAGFTEIRSRFDKSENIFRYYFMNQTGEIISDELFSHVDIGLYDGNGVVGPISLRGYIPLPSDRSSIMDVDNEGNIYWAWTEDVSVNVYDSTGRKFRIVTYPKQNVALDVEQMLAVYDYNLQLYRKAKKKQTPDTMPAMDYFFVDDEERLWISIITESEDTYKWVVISKDGDYLASFDWEGIPLERHYKPREIKMVKNNYLYTSEMNDDTNLPEVVKYKIELTER